MTTDSNQLTKTVSTTFFQRGNPNAKPQTVTRVEATGPLVRGSRVIENDKPTQVSKPIMRQHF